jgi:hypothetical protein
MKYLLLVLLTACHMAPPVYTKEGDIVCHADFECINHYYCGFKHINDEISVCLPRD